MNFTLLGYPAILASDTADNSKNATKYDYGLLKKYNLESYHQILDLNGRDVILNIPGTEYVGLRIDMKGSYICLLPDDITFMLDWILEFQNYYKYRANISERITSVIRYVDDVRILSDTINTDFNFISVSPDSIYARLWFGKKFRKQDINTIKMIELLSNVAYRNEIVRNSKNSNKLSDEDIDYNKGKQAVKNEHFGTGGKCIIIDPHNVSQKYVELTGRLKEKGMTDDDIRTLVYYLTNILKVRSIDSKVPSAFSVTERFISDSIAIPISSEMGIGDTVIDCIDNMDYLQDIHYSDARDRRILNTKNFGITVNDEEYLYPVPTTFEIHAPNNRVIYPFGIKMTAHWKEVDSGTIFQIAGSHPVWSYLPPDRIFEYIDILNPMEITIIPGVDADIYESHTKGRWKYPYMNINSTPVSNDLAVCRAATYPDSGIHNTEYYLIKNCREELVKNGMLSRILAFFNPITSKLSVTIDYNHMTFYNKQKD